MKKILLLCASVCLSTFAFSQSARLYQHRDFGGNMLELSRGYEIAEMPHQDFWSGFGWGYLAVYNDEISSIRIPPGLHVTVWEHLNFTGASVTFTSDQPYVGDYWNDKITSLRVW